MIASITIMLTLIQWRIAVIHKWIDSIHMRIGIIAVIGMISFHGRRHFTQKISVCNGSLVGTKAPGTNVTIPWLSASKHGLSYPYSAYVATYCGIKPKRSSHALTTDWRRTRTAVARQRPGSVAQEPLSASAHPAAPVLRRRPQAVLRSGQRLQSAILGQHVTSGERLWFQQEST
eukprot:jgi/Chrzof1/7024/Cz02g07300.t1